jgi:hypothetical protein
MFFWPRQPLHTLEVVLPGRQFMPVAGLAGLNAAYLTSRTSPVMIVILYVVCEQIPSGVSFQCVLQLVHQ